MRSETTLKFKLKEFPKNLMNKIQSSIFSVQTYFKLDASNQHILTDYVGPNINVSNIYGGSLHCNYHSVSKDMQSINYLKINCPHELSIDLTNDQYIELLGKIPKFGVVMLDRNFMSLNSFDLSMDINVYKSELSGLIVAEVTFDPNIIVDESELMSKINQYVDVSDEITENKIYDHDQLALKCPI